MFSSSLASLSSLQQAALYRLALSLTLSYPPHPTQEFVEGEFFAGELYVDEAKASFQQLGFKR